MMIGTEQYEPGLSQGPGGHDVGDHRQLIDDPPARHIGADHQPGHRSANHQCNQGGPSRYGERMLQWDIQKNLAKGACQHPDPVKNRECAYLGIRDTGEIVKLPGERSCDHAV
jgi:hypothetical protein